MSAPSREAAVRTPNVLATVARREERFGLCLLRPPASPVPSDRVLRIQGYSDLGRVRPAIRKAADAMALVASRLSQPEVAFRHVRIEAIADGTLRLEAGVQMRCAVFEQTLARCTEVVPFVLTVGARLGERVVRLADQGDLLEAVLLEAAGWLCIEDATRQFKSRLRLACAKNGQRITSRLGPGYSYKVAGESCMWRLEEQAALFAALGEASRLPVELMPSCAMQPKLSRSGMYGVAPADAPWPTTASRHDEDRKETVP